MYRHAYVMFRALEMMTLDLLRLYSNNTVPKYLEQSIRDSKVRPRFLITLTLSSFLILNFKRRS